MDKFNITDKESFIFDFDGTICFLFKHFDLGQTKIDLKHEMLKFNLIFDVTLDAFDVFEAIKKQTEHNHELRIKAYRAANKILTEAEVNAVKKTEIIKGFRELLDLMYEQGFKIAIATNNSVESVKTFFDIYYPKFKGLIVGRVPDKPELLKSNPWSINQVIKEMNLDLKKTLFIGDTKRDYDASINAGCDFLAMASNERKKQRLEAITSNLPMIHDFDEMISILSNQ